MSSHHHVRQILGGNDDDDDSGSQYPFWWIVVPVVIAIAIACMVTLLRYRRRQLRRTLAGCNSALRRDIEAMGPPSNHRPARATAAGRPWYHSSSAGQWRMRPNGLSRFARHHDEGLNELGEAPPAYTPPRQKEQSAVDEVELGHIAPPQADVTVPPTAATATPAASDVPEQGGPPPYNEAQQASGLRPIPESMASPAEGPERPSPALLGSR